MFDFFVCANDPLRMWLFAEEAELRPIRGGEATPNGKSIIDLWLCEKGLIQAAGENRSGGGLERHSIVYSATLTKWQENCSREQTYRFIYPYLSVDIVLNTVLIQNISRETLRSTQKP